MPNKISERDWTLKIDKQLCSPPFLPLSLISYQKQQKDKKKQKNFVNIKRK